MHSGLMFGRGRHVNLSTSVLALVVAFVGMALLVPGIARAAAPSLAVSPTTGSPGTGLTVSGSGWPAGDSIFVQIGSSSFDNDIVCVLTADSSGKISGTQAANGCVVPNVANGTQPLVGIDEQSMGTVSHGTFAVTGGFGITPGQGQVGSPSSPGTTVSAVGHGFAPNSTISGFKFDGKALTTSPASVQTDANGNATGAVTFTIPATATAGANTVTATDAKGNVGTQNITIFLATATVTPTSGSPGTGLKVTGSGWPAGDSIFVQIGSTSFDTDIVCVLTANTSGKISGTQAANGCVVPNVPNGSRPLVGIDEQNLGIVSHATFTVNGGFALTPGQGQVGSPSSPGTTVSAVGHGFAPNSTISGFKFDGKALTTSPSSVQTDANGNATSAVTFTIPATAKKGTNTVTATDAAGNVGTQKITIYLAKATVTPTSGSPGTGLTVTGSGWPKGDTIFVQIGSTSFDTDIACVLTATSKGKISGTQAANGCVVPNVPNGSQPLVGIAEQSLGVVSHTTFTVKGGFALTPGQGQVGSPSTPGTTVSAVGHGFAPNSTISGFKFDGVALVTTPSSVQTDASGNATSAITFTIPATATAGTNTVTATDAAGNVGTQNITIYLATATVTPTSGSPGTGLTVTGSGWPAGDSIFVQIGSSSFDNDIVCVLTADSSGKISGTQAANGCVVPNVPNGSQPLVGIDEQNLGIVSHATFTVNGGFALTPGQGQVGSASSPGTTVSAVGHGFAPNSTISGFKFDGVAVTTSPSSVQTDANGNATSAVTFTIPATAKAGTNTVTATDAKGNVGTQAITIFLVTATVTPTSGSPGAGLTVTGSGWPAGDTIFVQIGSTSFDTDIVCVLTANASGAISGTPAANGCEVPNVATGTQPLVGIDEQGLGIVSHGTFTVK